MGKQPHPVYKIKGDTSLFDATASIGPKKSTLTHRSVDRRSQ
jgi:hypothetical protein